MYNKRNIFLDLDETLIDTSERHYQVYCDIINVLNLKEQVNKEEFWKKKRQGFSTVEIIGDIDNRTSMEFSKLWVENIERRKYLVYDKLLDNTLDLLSKLTKEKLIVLTMRNNRKNLIWELKKLGIYDKFDSILSCSPLKNKDKSVPLLEYTRENNICLDNNSIIVGDSETDIITGKKLNLTTIAVTYGIRSEKTLFPLKPEYCIRNMDELCMVLKNLENNNDKSI
jgi:phosphoglycolate phosphatase